MLKRHFLLIENLRKCLSLNNDRRRVGVSEIFIKFMVITRIKINDNALVCVYKNSKTSNKANVTLILTLYICNKCTVTNKS